ncbi:MAG: hypothetical protein ISS48_03000 [Candidatus Aenigmarchaeota archaeon]|nr:hypothetical protein [Candidatus Aenigmarchaeota archaeon]
MVRKSIDISGLSVEELRNYIRSDRFGYTRRDHDVRTGGYRLVQLPNGNIVRAIWPSLRGTRLGQKEPEQMMNILRDLDEVASEEGNVSVDFYLYSEPFTYSDLRLRTRVLLTYGQAVSVIRNHLTIPRAIEEETTRAAEMRDQGYEFSMKCGEQVCALYGLPDEGEYVSLVSDIYPDEAKTMLGLAGVEGFELRREK